MWNILNRNRCETMADLFRDSVRFGRDYYDAIVKILKSNYKDALECGDLLCLSRGSLYYLSWIEEEGKINLIEYDEFKKKSVLEVMEWLGYLFQSWYEDFGVTGKEIVDKFSKEDYEWLINNWAILHTQDTKYVFEELKSTRKIEFII